MEEMDKAILQVLEQYRVFESEIENVLEITFLLRDAVQAVFDAVDGSNKLEATKWWNASAWMDRLARKLDALRGTTAERILICLVVRATVPARLCSARASD